VCGLDLGNEFAFSSDICILVKAVYLDIAAHKLDLAKPAGNLALTPAAPAQFAQPAQQQMVKKLGQLIGEPVLSKAVGPGTHKLQQIYDAVVANEKMNEEKEQQRQIQKGSVKGVAVPQSEDGRQPLLVQGDSKPEPAERTGTESQKKPDESDPTAAIAVPQSEDGRQPLLVQGDSTTEPAERKGTEPQKKSEESDHTAASSTREHERRVEVGDTVITSSGNFKDKFDNMKGCVTYTWSQRVKAELLEGQACNTERFQSQECAVVDAASHRAAHGWYFRRCCAEGGGENGG